MTSRFVILPATLLLALAGCENPFGSKVCTDEARPGLLIAVVDSATGAAVLQGATIVVQSATFHDQVTIPDAPWPSDVVNTAYEAPGTYTVTVRKSGYRDWVRAGVSVARGECHVKTVELLVKLQR